VPTAEPTAAPTATPAAATPKPTRKAITTVAGTVTGYPGYYYEGNTIFSNPEGWLYLDDEWQVDLWGLEENNTVGTVERLDIPSQIDGHPVLYVAPDSATVRDRPDKVLSFTCRRESSGSSPALFPRSPLETLDLPAGIGLATIYWTPPATGFPA
jgi:hypothetical protein